jgi:WhiB family redox-sensing transcriptional regulator
VVDIQRLADLASGAWDWQRDAACRAMGDSTFFHPTDEREPGRSQRVERAKAICASCHVVTECRAYALRVREPYGVWGGLSEPERASLLGLRTLRYPGQPRRPSAVGLAHTG